MKLPKKILRESFSIALKKCLLQRYQELPSAAFVAKEFNLRSHTTESITQETARRWMRGLVIPDLAKLLVLRAWLDLDINTLGMQNPESPDKSSNTLNHNLAEQEAFIRTTQSIRQSLHSLMDDVASLEKKITR